MKLINNFGAIAILLLSFIVLSACSKDNDEGDTNTNSNSLNINDAIGTWMCTKSTDEYMGNKVEGLLVGAEVTINRDRTFTSTSTSFGLSGTYSYRGNEITAKSESGTFVITAKVSGSNMYWNGTASNGVKFNYTFKKE